LPQRYSYLTLRLLYAIAYCILIPTNAKLLITLCFVQINSLPPEIVSYFTDPNATGPPPDMQLLVPFVESALPVAYGVLAIQVFHVIDTLPVENLFVYQFFHVASSSSTCFKSTSYDTIMYAGSWTFLGSISKKCETGHSFLHPELHPRNFWCNYSG
jgi:hypothetical protein